MPRRKPKAPGAPTRAGEVADQLLQVRMTVGELDAIDRHVKRLGLDRSTFVREAIDVALGVDSLSDRGKVMRELETIEQALEAIRDVV